jgi:dTDP-4-dehydrorhamnose 3,5-epimerase
MKFEPLPLMGAYLIKPESKEDERGKFYRVFCTREFEAEGLETVFVQANMSINIVAGTVRGLHLQRPPYAEVKLVRCIRGAIFDVILDLRETSATYGTYFGAVLDDANGSAMYVPKGFAHGYQSLTGEAAVHYMVSAYYTPDHEAGIHHADPAIGIKWPLPIKIVSAKDAKLPFLKK